MSTQTEPINEVYSRRILEIAADVTRQGRLETPHGSATVSSPLCGSRVTVDLRLEGGRVSDFAHEVRACALGQTASAVMARHVVGSTIEELRDVRSTMHAMLKEDGPPPTGKWADLEVLTPVRAYRARHGSVLLTFDAVVKAIDGALAGEPSP
ncbi:MAG: iron-sulfur cluster assembly scaffold protein [Pseudomonadota bacterium]